MAFVEVRNLTKSYASGVQALRDVTFDVKKGEWIAVMGPSGSGKSTLLNILGCLDAPTSGAVEVEGRDLAALGAAERARFRAERVGFVFQQYHLVPYLTAVENVMLAMMFADAVPRRLQRPRASELLARLGLSERLAHKPAQLSRGEQQRVAIARALANSPPLILADEPCASLDASTASEVLAIFLAVCRQDEKTLLLVSHDEAVLGVADRVIDMAELNRTEARKGLRMTAAVSR